jgi:hypothetical protein
MASPHELSVHAWRHCCVWCIWLTNWRKSSLQFLRVPLKIGVITIFLLFVFAFNIQSISSIPTSLNNHIMIRNVTSRMKETRSITRYAVKHFIFFLTEIGFIYDSNSSRYRYLRIVLTGVIINGTATTITHIRWVVRRTKTWIFDLF